MAKSLRHPADVDALAVEVGIDAKEWKLHGPRAQTRKVTIKLSDERWAALKAEAARRGTDMQALILEWIGPQLAKLPPGWPYRPGDRDD